MSVPIKIPKPITGDAGDAVLVALAAKANVSKPTLISFIAGATPKQARTRVGHTWLVRNGYLPKPMTPDPDLSIDADAPAVGA